MYLKVAEKVDILEQIVNAKFENEKEKDNRYAGCKIWGILFSNIISAACISLLQHPNCNRLLSAILALIC